MSLVTVNNLYENGVCDEFTIYTGTTYNGDPYIIPVSAQSIGSHSLPHTFDVGGYEGPLYIFLVHCDFYVTPPPSETPKRQGGFQVKLINIDCENCPPFSPVATPIPTPSPSPTPTTDCNFTVNFVEYSPAPSPTPSPSPSPTPTPTDEVACQCFEINSNRQGYFSYSYVDCDGVTVNATSDTPPMEEITFHVCAQSIISVAEKVTYSVYGTCTDGVCDNTPAPSPTQSPTPTASSTPTPTPTPTPTTQESFNCGIVGLNVEDGVAGESVVFTTNSGYGSGTISPSEYTMNPYITYDYTIEVPSGYSNSGTSVICSDNDVTVTNPPNPPTNQNIIIKGFVSGSSGSSFPVYDGMGDIGEYNINGSGGNGSGKAHQIYNGSDETIYVRLMAKTYGGNQSFDAMAKILFSNPAQDVGDLIYIGNTGGSQNANYQTTISNNNPAYGGAQWVIEIPPTGYNSVTVGIHPAYYVPDGDNVYYTFAWSLNEVFVRADQNEITTYVA